MIYEQSHDDKPKAMKNLPRVLWLPLCLMALYCGCSSTASTNSGPNVNDTIYEAIDLTNPYDCSDPVPSLDSATFGEYGIDAGIFFSFRGITKPGTYQFGEHNSIYVDCESFVNVSARHAQTGGSFILTKLQNRIDSPIFEGRVDMIFLDTITSYFQTQIHIVRDTGSFSVHTVCQ